MTKLSEKLFTLVRARQLILFLSLRQGSHHRRQSVATFQLPGSEIMKSLKFDCCDKLPRAGLRTRKKLAQFEQREPFCLFFVAIPSYLRYYRGRYLCPETTPSVVKRRRVGRNKTLFPRKSFARAISVLLVFFEHYLKEQRAGGPCF